MDNIIKNLREATMNIFAGRGDKICLHNHPLFGTDSDQKHAKKLLDPNTVYTIDVVDVGQSHSEVLLKEFPKEYFNTVLFEDVDVNILKANARKETWNLYN